MKMLSKGKKKQQNISNAFSRHSKKAIWSVDSKVVPQQGQWLRLISNLALKEAHNLWQFHCWGLMFFKSFHMGVGKKSVFSSVVWIKIISTAQKMSVLYNPWLSVWGFICIMTLLISRSDDWLTRAIILAERQRDSWWTGVCKPFH